MMDWVGDEFSYNFIFMAWESRYLRIWQRSIAEILKGGGGEIYDRSIAFPDDTRGIYSLHSLLSPAIYAECNIE
jgi:hypothetical protein